MNNEKNNNMVNAQLPPISLLDKTDTSNDIVGELFVRKMFPMLLGELVEEEEQPPIAVNMLAKLEVVDKVLANLGIEAKLVSITRGPLDIRFKLVPVGEVSYNKKNAIAEIVDLNFGLSGVRASLITTKNAISIELAMRVREKVTLRELIDSKEFKDSDGKLCFAVGKNMENDVVVANLKEMPHLLIAGTTGSGKSVFMHSIIMSLLYRATSDEVKLMLIDPKQVKFPRYNGIPHLLAPVITEARKAAGALGWAVTEMNRRYSLFSDNAVRNLDGYNDIARKSDDLEVLPHIVIVIDELADLMKVASNEAEASICRLAQLGKAAGMHLIIATNSLKADVVTGLIKANLPSRVALKVSNGTDSRIILDDGGAEKLLGNGDILYKPAGCSAAERIQCGYASTAEIIAVVKFLRDQQTAVYDKEVLDGIEKNIPAPPDIEASEPDDMLEEAIKIVIENHNASASFLQSKARLAYTRALRLLNAMEAMGIVGPADGGKPREVLMTMSQWQEKVYEDVDKAAEAMQNEESDDDLDTEMLSRSIEWLRSKNTSSGDILDFIKYILK